MASGLPEAAICVQDIDVQCVLQFTLIHAAGCALHRHTSRVIHRLELSFRYRVCSIVGARRRPAQRCRSTSQRHETRRRVSSQSLLDNNRGLKDDFVAYVGDRYGDSLNLAQAELYPSAPTRASTRVEKGTRNEYATTTRKRHVRATDWFFKPETQGTRTRTPLIGARRRKGPSSPTRTAS